jgi:predicted dehydrogenase
LIENHEKPNLDVGILGGGSTSAVGRAHVSAIRLLGNVGISAGCFSLDPSKNLSSAKAYGVNPDRVYSNIDSLIKAEKNRISAIVVLTPTQNHFQDVRKILENGINVICEKSISSSVREAETLVDAANKYKVKLFVTFNYTGYPMLREIREVVKQGTLGEIHTVNAIMPQEGFAKRGLDDQPIFPQNWRLTDSDIPTISLDLGVHLVNLLTFTTNLEIVELIAVQNKRGNFNVYDDVHVISKLNNSGVCNIWYTKAALGNRNGLSIQLYGKEGSIVWVQESPEQYVLTDKYGNQNLVNRGTQGLRVANSERYLRFKPGHPSGFIEAFANYYEDIFTELSGATDSGAPYCFTGIEALNGLKVMDAISSSSRQNKWVAIEVK